MTKNHKAGTGDEFGRLDLGEIGELVVEDDGDTDRVTVTKFIDRDGSQETLAHSIYKLRCEEGDEFVLDELEELERRLQHDPMTRPDDDSSPSASSLGRPVAFKCDECGFTCPRTWNTNPGDGRDVCKQCDEDDP